MENEKKAAPPVLIEDITIELYYPVTLGKSEDAETVSSLTFRRPRGREMRDFPGRPTMNDLMRLASKLSGQPPAVFDMLEMPDFKRVMEAVGDFLGSGQSTGGTQ